MTAFPVFTFCLRGFKSVPTTGPQCVSLPLSALVGLAIGRMERIVNGM